MTTGSVWLVKLLLAHLITDFILQPTPWIEDRNKNHFYSKKLYLHGAITGLGALIFVGWEYWPQVLIIVTTHILIDGWKSYQKETHYRPAAGIARSIFRNRSAGNSQRHHPFQ